MTDDAPATCRACGSPILWATSTKGRPMPLNLPPEGRYVIEQHRSGPVASYSETYISHFATCPKADEFRRAP